MKVVLTNTLLVIAVIAAIIFTGNPLALMALMWLQVPPPPKYLVPQQPQDTADPVNQMGFVHTDDDDE